jgi:DMSO/TMAO reductase YedYZ molybdopterin-dependent catalytic subunit
MEESRPIVKPPSTPGIFAGAFVGAMLTAALIAIFYAAWKLAGLPFVPFDVFDWTTRVLPGRLIAFGIHTMVTIIRALHVGPTSVVAKAAEQAMGITGLFATGIVGGAVLFGVLRILRGRFAYLLGLALGTAVGVPVLLISYYLSQTASVAPAVRALWILAIFLLWGLAFGWAHRRLTTVGAAAVAPPPPGVVLPQPRTAGLQETSAIRVNRRQFLVRLGGATATITVAGAMVGVLAQGRRSKPVIPAGLQPWSTTHALPNADAAVTPAPGTRPEYTPLEQHYRIDINTIPPAVDASQWRLKIGGLVDQPLSLTLDDLQRYEPMHQFITLACISNPVGGDLIGTIRWTGVSLQRLLPDLRLRPEATHLKIRSADGFYEVVPLETIQSDERVMLTYAWDGVPLLMEHGFPLRIYIPDVYGMKQPKWIESVEATDHWEPGYWVVRGWDKVARMKATSVIDTVAADALITETDGRRLVPIGGIAHAGARGISKVELQVDNGPWQEAELRTPLSNLTWVIWRYNWPFQAGAHRFTVRCYDGSGTPQIVTPNPPEPNGATGLDSKTQRLSERV